MNGEAVRMRRIRLKSVLDSAGYIGDCRVIFSGRRGVRASVCMSAFI